MYALAALFVAFLVVMCCDSPYIPQDANMYSNASGAKQG